MTLDALSPSAAAERYVLGAVLREPAVLRDVQERVMPRDFEDMRLGAVYAGICRMAVEGVPVDYIAVGDRLADWDVRGLGISDLADWEASVSTAQNVGYWADRVRAASMRRAVREVAARLGQAEDAGPAMQQAITELTEIRDRDAVGAQRVTWLRDVLNVPETEDAYDWVIPDVLERRDRLMLTGSEGGGKSTMLRQLAVLAAAGVHPFQFTPIPPIRVLVVDAENSERQWRRATRGLADQAAMRGRDPGEHVALECVKSIDITRAGDLASIHRRIDEVRPDLLLVGPLYRLVPRAIQSDDDAAPVLAALDSLRDREVAMLIEAHAGHAGSAQGERDLRPRGSSALLGWPEFGLGLRREKTTPGQQGKASLIRWRGDRDQRRLPTKFMRGFIFPWEPIYSGEGHGNRG